ncbi:glycoside hydrolase family 2 protein [Parablautia intestinalis]|uniref:Beta-mannosidase B n=1 Tax=Parablautia intestinalis TaxID=2320100 RepID=A0A3A9AIC3_9FIRM|nr:glycoside hydrolase family 2 protein [Parablautia intestinalis]RKI91340.1 glycoside hydrolase family 2 protein [Parablautia intestinalis]
MLKTSLNGVWNLQIIGKDSALVPKEGISAKIPGSVYGALLEKELIPDPFYRDNELKVLPLMENDFCYTTDFEVTNQMLACDALLLRFDGIDTLADICLNGEQIGCAYNMHRIWEINLLETGSIREGNNQLKVVLHSPTKYIKEENEKVAVQGSQDAMEGFPHLRKAHCMFGWDWGPRLPDAGIFRDVTLLGIKKSRLDSVYITQIHEAGQVTLDFDITLELFCNRESGLFGDGGKVRITVTDPDGQVVAAEDTAGEEQDYKLTVKNPRLWWPHGYGDQPLYQVRVSLLDGDDSELDVWERKIGLRTMTVNTDKDEWGSCFAHEVNGVKIFAMGADYIPEDNLLDRVNKERTRRLLEDAAMANHNCIRVWGGGYYPDDFFFDICDELGLIVWQDFMYACASYELNDAFEANITRETIDNVRRIRHHACLGLWCGNNEIETQIEMWKVSEKQKYDYIKLYEYIIPKIIKEEDPNAFYWPSSPSSGGNFENSWSEDHGDMHYWDVWHGNKPFTEYRKFHFRYLSEFGFQSFPGLKTVESFTEPEDRNIFSRVMEMHQRNRAANGKILNYLSAIYLYPKDFDHLLYASQLLQADAIRYGVEHFRRYRGRCMGTVVWQLNDIWPVASWASIDYYGRWKALHYAEKKMFAPVMISCEEIGELSERPFCIQEPAPIEKSARLHVANETMQEVTGTVTWSLRKPDSSILKEGSCQITVPALDGVWLEKMDFGAYEEREIHLEYSFCVDGRVVSQNTCLFTAPKHYFFANPNLRCERKGDKIVVYADAYAKNVEIIGTDGDLWLSDNFFDMEAGERIVSIIRGDAKSVTCRSVVDIA